ncbi:MAG TPA: fasciclin domain-containing protein [Euzebyales bacterium]|nr:fasciclin domain-containing protein [Euzebyales bacterium]
MKRSLRLLSLLAATVLALAACSTAEEAGEEASEPGAPAITSEPAVEEPASEPMVSEPADDTDTELDAGTADSILDLASENPQLSQLVAAIEAAGLTETLEQAGPITVFAPNDDAFAALDQGDLTALLADPASLGDRLQYHVVEGSYTSSDLSDGDTLTTLEGSDLSVSVDGETVTVGGAEVVEADLEAGNGVIHIIDTVLQP